MLHRLRRRRIRYADSHVHLDRYSDVEVDAIVARARAAGVIAMLTVGTGVSSSERGVALARRHRGVIAAAGVHPRYAGGTDIDAVRRIASDGRDVVRAIGEIGIDRAEAGPPLRGQMVAFQFQLALARELALPVVLHGAGAHAEVAAVLSSLRARLPAVVVHYFAGTASDLERYLNLDCYVSFGRLVLKPGQDALRALVPQVPAHRLLVETDTYPLPDRSTEPKDVVEVVRLMAALRGEHEAVTAALTLTNFRRAFGLVPA